MRLNSKHLQLGLLIDFVKFSIDNLEKTIEQLADLNTKNENINDLIEIERKQLVGEFKLYEMMSENEKQLYLKQQLRQHIKTAKQNKTTYSGKIVARANYSFLFCLFGEFQFQPEYYLTSTGQIKNKILKFEAINEKCLLILWRHIDFYLNNFDLSQTDGAQLFKNDLYSSGGSAEAEHLRRLGRK